MSTNKAQSLTYDFFIALAIFFIILTIAMSYWYYLTVQMEDNAKRNLASKTLLSASEVWFKEGYPKYWNTSNVVELGLANDGKINSTKMEMLSQLSYSKVASLLSLGTFNLKYEVYNKTNLIFQFPLNSDFSSAKNVYKIERIAILDEKPVKVRTIIWD
jgi:hypothetical protein